MKVWNWKVLWCHYCFQWICRKLNQSTVNNIFHWRNPKGIFFKTFLAITLYNIHFLPSLRHVYLLCVFFGLLIQWYFPCHFLLFFFLGLRRATRKKEFLSVKRGISLHFLVSLKCKSSLNPITNLCVLILYTNSITYQKRYTLVSSFPFWNRQLGLRNMTKQVAETFCWKEKKWTFKDSMKTPKSNKSR